MTFAPADSQQVPLTTYVIADLGSEEGAKFLKEALASVVILPLSLSLSLSRFRFLATLN